MKNNKLILIITLALGLLALVLIYTNKNSTIKSELKDFAVKDTNSITKIFIADKSNNRILLERTGNDGFWKLNGKYLARKEAISTLLFTMATLEVQSPVAKAAYNNVVKNIATNGIKVEIYQGSDKPSKVYYVGGATQEQTGTFMLLDNSSMPFIMHLPGFDGYLTTRYFTDEAEWKDHTVFRYKNGEIASLSFDYIGAPNSSFKIVKQGNKYQFLNFKTNVPDPEADSNRVNSFISFFTVLNYEGVDKAANKDSLFKRGPYLIVKIVNTKGVASEVPFYLKPNSDQKLDTYGKLSPHDVDHLYASTDGKTLLLLQYHVFDDILRTAEEFKKNRKLIVH